MKNVPARTEKIIICLSIVIFVFLTGLSIIKPLLALGAAPTPTPPCPDSQTITEVGCLPKDPIQFVTSFYTIGLGLIGGVALIFIMIGGYTILTSRGNPSQINVGKSYIFYSILGLLLAIFGYVFIEVFAIDILHLPGFSK